MNRPGFKKNGASHSATKLLHIFLITHLHGFFSAQVHLSSYFLSMISFNQHTEYRFFIMYKFHIFEILFDALAHESSRAHTTRGKWGRCERSGDSVKAVALRR